MHHQDFILIFHGFILLLVYGSSASHQRRGLGAGVSQVADFDCPEEFGYYPHPTDCTQYYVCVFGGALLESCTGGLMYSHELQTCDWPRNVGCGANENSDSGTVSTIRVTDPRTRAPQHSRAPVSQQQNTAAPPIARNAHRQEYIRQRQPEVIQQQLYTEEDIGPAEEIETDRQQRVYRGQPSTIGQVQRDRDGLRTIKNGVHSQNVIPTGPDSQEKISIVSYSNQRPSRPQDQYRDNATFTGDLHALTDVTDNWSVDSTKNLTKRWKRQIPYRSAKIPIILIPGPTSLPKTEPKTVRYANDPGRTTQSAFYGLARPGVIFYRPAVMYPRAQNKTIDNIQKLTKSTIQEEFRPILYTAVTHPPRKTSVRYIESAINPVKSPAQKIVVANVFYNYPNASKSYRLETTSEKIVAIGGRKKTTETPAIETSATTFSKYKPTVTEIPPDGRKPVTTAKKVYHSRFSAAATTERVIGGHYKFVETPKGYRYKPTEPPPVTGPEYHDKKYYNYDYYDSEYYDEKGTDSKERNPRFPTNSSELHYGSYETPKDYDYESSENMKTSEPHSDDEDYEKVTGRSETNPTKNFFSQNKQNLYTPHYESSTSPTHRLNVPGDRVNMQTIQAIAQGLKRPIRYRSTTTKPITEQFQIESPRKKIPEEYYENFRPFPTKSLTTVDDGRQRPYQPDEQRQSSVTTVTRGRTGVDQVQSFQVTSSLPPLAPTSRTIERYNTSQRYQPNQYDQYYTVYDEDADLYRGNDYPQQDYNTPSSTPSSNIVHQYRGQTTFKQQQQQQVIDLEETREPIQQRHQQPLRNSYNQDVYSPPPVVQDYNDQYNAQIDDQQYQHLIASTPKAPNRSVSTNSSKDTFPQSSITVSRISDNTTSKPETMDRRSDSKPFFEPSAILIPPQRIAHGFQRPSSSTPKYSYTTEGYRTISPSTQRSAEPPRNGGALAKTLNNFDSLLTSFFSAVSKKQSSPPKSVPETIVRSEIGRIHHDPIIITDNYHNREVFKPETITQPPPPPPNKNDDYLAYFVEIEPKKAKAQEIARSFGVSKAEAVSEPPKIITKDNIAKGQSDVVNFNLRSRGRPFNSFVRIVPNGEEHQNIQLGASLAIEPILKPTTTQQPQKTAPQELPIRREPSHPEVIQIPAISPTVEFRPQVEVSTERPRIRGNTFFRPRPAQDLQPKLIENANPYKFVVVNAEKTVEREPSNPAPFSRNPENEERNHLGEIQNRFRTSDAAVAGRDPKRFEIPTEVNIIRTDEEDSSESDNIKEFQQEESSEDVTQPEKIETSSVQSTESTTSTRKPFRIRVNPETDLEDSKKSRRIVKIHRSELRNQRLNQQKYKRIRKPSTRAPATSAEELAFNRENEIQSTYRPIIVLDGLSINKELSGGNRTSFLSSAEEPEDAGEATRSELGLYPLENISVVPVSDTIPRGFEKPKKRLFPPVELKPIVVPNREPSSSEKPLFLITSKPQTNRNVTVHENRATTTKPYVRGKFKPSDSSKIRFRPTTATPDSETTPGPHLSTRQPSYSIGSTGNEVTVNRGTPPSTNRGTRPTLKPSTAIVSKASEFIDIYRYPPRRPANLYATPTPDKSAAKCRKDVCLLPDCSCGGKDIPGGYSAEEIPQLVLLTFDDSVNDLNKGLYSELFERGRVNPNGCPISATFYVSHEWTDYSQVQNLYANGHEIASHSITHSFGEQFSQKKWTKEIAGQREILAAYGGVRLEDIRGMRAPFLAVGGNKMFKMLYDSNFTYDSSMPIYENRPPSWPYTLDYKLFHDCMIPPCPTKSYPGVWEVPMVMWQDLNGGRCSMGDACSNPPTADGVYKMLIKNFERHFTTNRAPFGLYYHAAWFTHEHHKEGFIAFLDTIVNMPEVWLVTTWQAIEWVRDPQPLSTVENFPPFQCNIEKAKKCNNPKVCNLWHKSGVRYMRTCQPCPDVYPWTGKTGVKNSRVDNEIIEE